MNRIGLFLITLVLCACQSISMNDTRQDGHEVTLHSEKGSDDVSQCILTTWQNEKDIFGIPYGAFIQPITNGKTVYVNGNLFIADITQEKNDKTLVKLYMYGINRNFIEITSKCL